MPHEVAFAASSAALLIVFVAAGVPIALFEVYREGGLTTADLTYGTISYFLGVAAALLFLTRLSDLVGRRPILALTAALAACGCMVLTQVHGPAPLMTGRALQGIACGLASSVIGAYVLETAPPRASSLTGLVVGTVPTLGVPLGALVSGVLVRWAPHPRWLGLVGVASIAALYMATLVASPETIERSSRTRGVSSALRPDLLLPPPSGRRFFVAFAFMVAGTWAMGGFYQAFGPAVASDVLGQPGPLFSAMLFASYVLPIPVGGALSVTSNPRKALRFGTLVFMLGMLGMTAGFFLADTTVFVAAAVLAGLGNGAGMASGVRGLLNMTGAGERDRMLASIYLVSYVGAIAPGMVASSAQPLLTLSKICSGYFVFSLLAASIAVRISRPTSVE